MADQTSSNTISTTDQTRMIALAKSMAGGFSNQQQAMANPVNYAHIRVFFRPLPWDFFGGIGFYSEQVYDYDLWRPYRQGIHRFVPQNNEVYVENYSLKDALLYAGSGRDLGILQSIKPTAIERRDNCSMIFRQEGDLFRGRVEGKYCFIEKRGKKTYLMSDVEITNESFVSWDRGLDVETNEHVWGSEHGALRFEKTESFASEVTFYS